MVSRKISCLVVEVPVHETAAQCSARTRPSQLLPWADPYIAALVHKLQDEVRAERAAGSRRNPARGTRPHNRIEHLAQPTAPSDFAAEVESTSLGSEDAMRDDIFDFPEFELSMDDFSADDEEWPLLDDRHPRRPR